MRTCAKTGAPPVEAWADIGVAMNYATRAGHAAIECHDKLEATGRLIDRHNAGAAEPGQP